MGVTNLDSLTLGNALIVTGTVTNAKTLASGTSRFSGVFSASAAGKQSTLTKLTVNGTTILTGKVTANNAANELRAASLAVTSAANSMCGLLVVPAAGTASAATTKALSSSRIFITPIKVPSATYKGVSAFIATIVSGTKFTVQMQRIQTAGTLATASGRVAWMIVNK